MQSGNTGKKILSIKIYKSKVTLTFGKNDKVDITPEVFTSHYLYVGKTLSNKEIATFEEENSLDAAYSYAKSLLLKAMYSEWGIRDKLYAKEYTKDVVDKVVTKLKKERLIDDKKLCKEYISYGNDKLWGKNKIIQELKKKGVFEETLKDLVFSPRTELVKANKLLPKLEKKYSNLPTSDKKQHIYNAIISQGFTHEIAVEVSRKAKSTKEKEEDALLKRAFSNTYSKALRTNKTKDGVKAYVFRSLSQKGYKMNDIRKLWEEKENENAE